MTSAARIITVLLLCLLIWQPVRVVFAQAEPPPPTTFQITLTDGYTFEVDEVWKQGDELWFRKGGIAKGLPLSSVKKFGPKSVSPPAVATKPATSTAPATPAAPL